MGWEAPPQTLNWPMRGSNHWLLPKCSLLWWKAFSFPALKCMPIFETATFVTPHSLPVRPANEVALRSALSLCLPSVSVPPFLLGWQRSGPVCVGKLPGSSRCTQEGLTTQVAYIFPYEHVCQHELSAKKTLSLVLGASSFYLLIESQSTSPGSAHIPPPLCRSQS